SSADRIHALLLCSGVARAQFLAIGQRHSATQLVRLARGGSNLGLTRFLNLPAQRKGRGRAEDPTFTDTQPLGEGVHPPWQCQWAVNRAQSNGTGRAVGTCYPEGSLVLREGVGYL
ncbi:hypothetical protein chiPu_0024202, partial [Chiloscyllium punctatum]|nr:hypothetical protein [Chiloscyllium punctatum]